MLLLSFSPIVGYARSQQGFHAVRGEGSHLDGDLISCSDVDDLSECMVCVEMLSRHVENSSRTLAFQRLEALVDRAVRARIIDVSSLGLAWCAMGGFDLYVNPGSAAGHIDTAAGELIVEEAGGSSLKPND